MHISNELQPHKNGIERSGSTYNLGGGGWGMA